MFGGQMANGEASGELYVLRALKKGLAWVSGSKMCQGKSPEPRFDHAMHRLRDNLVVLGGRNRTSFTPTVYLLDLTQLLWTNVQLKTGPDQPLAKSVLERAEFGVAGSRFENKVYIFGGIDNNFVLTNEALELNFDQLHINPLVADQYRNVKILSDKDQAVDLQFFNISKQDGNDPNMSHHKPNTNEDHHLLSSGSRHLPNNFSSSRKTTNSVRNRLQQAKID